MERLYKISLFCGLAPLAIGTTVFILSLATEWNFLWILGVLTLYGGIAAFFVGIICLYKFYWERDENSYLKKKYSLTKILLVGGILLLNFPVASFYISVISTYSGSHNIIFPKEIYSSQKIMPKNYEWCYLGMKYSDFTKKSNNLKSASNFRISNGAGSGYSVSFLFNRDQLSSDGIKKPAPDDRLTAVIVRGLFPLPESLLGLDYDVYQPSENNIVHKTPHLLYENDDYIVTLRVSKNYEGKKRRHLTIHYPIANYTKVEVGEHNKISGDNQSIIDSILKFNNK